VPVNTDSIGYTGDSFYRSKDQTNSIKVLKEKATKVSWNVSTKKLNCNNMLYIKCHIIQTMLG